MIWAMQESAAELRSSYRSFKRRTTVDRIADCGDVESRAAEDRTAGCGGGKGKTKPKGPRLSNENRGSQMNPGWLRDVSAAYSPAPFTVEEFKLVTSLVRQGDIAQKLKAAGTYKFWVSMKERTNAPIKQGKHRDERLDAQLKKESESGRNWKNTRQRIRRNHDLRRVLADNMRNLSAKNDPAWHLFSSYSRYALYVERKLDIAIEQHGGLWEPDSDTDDIGYDSDYPMKFNPYIKARVRKAAEPDFTGTASVSGQPDDASTKEPPTETSKFGQPDDVEVGRSRLRGSGGAPAPGSSRKPTPKAQTARADEEKRPSHTTRHTSFAEQCGEICQNGVACNYLSPCQLKTDHSNRIAHICDACARNKDREEFNEVRRTVFGDKKPRTEDRPWRPTGGSSSSSSAPTGNQRSGQPDRDSSQWQNRQDWWSSWRDWSESGWGNRSWDRRDRDWRDDRWRW